MSSRWKYPPVRRDENFYEELHGHKVYDPYRWLEDPDSEETNDFVTKQNELFYKIIESYPYREKFREKLTSMYDYERYECPFKRGDYYYYFYNTGLQQQSVLYRLQSFQADAKVFFDPNTLEEDGTAAIRTYTFSESGKYFAYSISKSGSDWATAYVKTTVEGSNEKLDDVIEWLKFTSLDFTHDEAGFFYSRYPEPETDDKGTEIDKNMNSMVYYHKLGSLQSEDILVYKDPLHPEYLHSVEVSDDGRYVLLYVSRGTERVNKLWIADLHKTGGQVTVDNFDAAYNYLTNDETIFYFQTNSNAPRSKIVRYDLSKPEEGFVDLVPECPDDILSSARVVHQNNLVLTYLHDVKEEIYIYSLHTGAKIRQLEIPIGAIAEVSGRKKDAEMFFYFSNFLNPGIIYQYNFVNSVLRVFKKTVVPGLNTDNLCTKQVFVSSKDGTKVPVFITSRKGVQLNGDNPTLLYGYGGFNIVVKPTFSLTWLMFILFYKGVVAVANIRGGGEYGEEWHRAGTLQHKQNCFDDFQSVAKWLASVKYTRPARLVINGGSNGGLLVGACINQAPELFGAAVSDVGVLDLLRYHKFTIGHAWKSDYGDPDKEEDFGYIYKYSPLHNVQSEKPYPSVLVTTSDHDDRVPPLHSYKFIAQLQHVAKNNPNPLAIRIGVKAGHGAGKPTKKRLEEAADKFSFILMALGADWTDS
ncbi:6172_t:CDS:10 [Paraglomus occultum]|uniref:Prolyl endopeptidase n=1 Tax=Paraglomus occultum TaxID=144539 RepID=A0A9N8WBH5_9GLOM|nr:6172_t:CDS:10 [Paraglomus occultum]